jgi:hypothetical protein
MRMVKNEKSDWMICLSLANLYTDGHMYMYFLLFLVKETSSSSRNINFNQVFRIQLDLSFFLIYCSISFISSNFCFPSSIFRFSFVHWKRSCCLFTCEKGIHGDLEQWIDVSSIVLFFLGDRQKERTRKNNKHSKVCICCHAFLVCFSFSLLSVYCFYTSIRLFSSSVKIGSHMFDISWLQIHRQKQIKWRIRFDAVPRQSRFSCCHGPWNSRRNWSHAFFSSLCSSTVPKDKQRYSKRVYEGFVLFYFLRLINIY